MLRRIIILGLKKANIRTTVYFSTIKNEPSDNFGFYKANSVFQPQELNIVISENIDNKKYVSPNDWSYIKESLKSMRGINDNNIDSIILQYLINTRRLEHGKDYVKQLKENNVTLSIALVGNLMKLYCLCGRDQISNKEKQEIVDSYKFFVKKYKVLDFKTNSDFARALLLTDQWRESLNILNKIKKVDRPPKHLYNSIIETAFYYGDIDVGWRLLEEMSQYNINPDHNCYTSWLKYSLSAFENNKTAVLENLERMLYFCGDKNLFMPLDTIVQYKNAFCNELGWKAELVSINPSGYCNICKSKLQSIDVTPDEFQILKNTFYDRVVIGKNVFIKSTPEETEKYLKFLEENAPFDIVLDGLNILYSIPNMKSSDILLNIVKHFVNMNKRVLVLGRRHLVKDLNKEQLKYIADNACVFLAEDLSYDDVFLLYASLHSDKTQFISRDIMKSHKFLLKDKYVKAIFNKWQRKNQLVLQYVEKNGNIIFKAPLKYLGSAQKSTGWHIPYILEDVHALPDTFDFPKDWICLQPNHDKTPQT